MPYCTGKYSKTLFAQFKPLTYISPLSTTLFPERTVPAPPNPPGNTTLQDYSVSYVYCGDFIDVVVVLSTWKTGGVTSYVQHLCFFDAINNAFTYTAANMDLSVPYTGDLINPSSHINITAVASSFRDRFYILWKNVATVKLSVFSYSYANSTLTVTMLETVQISANAQGYLGDGLIISTKLNLVLVTQKNSE